MNSGRPSILIVDDDPALRATLRGMLENLGYEPVAVSAAEAARALADHRFAAVLLDARATTPSELVRRLRIDEGGSRRTPALGVVDASADARARCLAAGMDDCIGAPFRMRDLAELLLRWIEDRDETSAAPEQPILDLEMIATLRQYNLLKQLVPVYLSTLPELIAALQRAIAADDRQAIRQRAHHLRSSSVQMGAAALARVLGEIEAMVVTRADGRLAAAGAALDGLMHATVDALNRENADAP